MCGDGNEKRVDAETLRLKLAIPNAERIFHLAQAFQDGMSIDEVFELTKIDRWFLHNVRQIVDAERNASRARFPNLRRAKKLGFSDRQLAVAQRIDSEPKFARSARRRASFPPIAWSIPARRSSKRSRPITIRPTATRTKCARSDQRKIMILGGGPNRIGQGIEFDYCCVHAAFALRELGFETIMVNSNPETVSTDYDTSDKLYFEPLTLEDVLNIYDQEQPEGVIVQFGGQTPLNLAAGLRAAGVPIIGTQPESIERRKTGNCSPRCSTNSGCARRRVARRCSAEEAVAIARTHRLSGARSAVVRSRRPRDGAGLQRAKIFAATCRTRFEVSPDRPVLVDRFLEDAIEVDVDCIADGEIAVIGAIMEHIEQAGIHSGDSACVIPTFSLSKDVLDEIATATKAMARELNVRGLMNVQFAVKGEDVYVLEVNPRASRTVPFVSKAIGVPLAKLAAKVMAGKTLRELGFTEGDRAETFLGERSRFPLSALSRRRHRAGAGNEIDRRSDGNRCRSRPRLREIANGRAAAVAEERKRLHQRERHRQRKRHSAGARIRRARFRHHRHERNGGRRWQQPAFR